MLNFLQDAITILNRDYIRNYCILELIRISKSQQIDADIENDAVFIRLNDNGSFVMLSAPEKRDGELLLKRNLTSDDKYFYTIDEWPAITEGKKLKYSSNCVQLYLPDDVLVEEDIADVVPLTEDMAPYIHEHYDYKHFVTMAYIRDRIAVGPAFGIIENGVLAGWAMTHEEGTMGVLTVLPEYRRRGYGNRITAALVKRLRELGKPCLVHIVKDNAPSLTLSKKNGMVYSCDVHWVGIDE